MNVPTRRMLVSKERYPEITSAVLANILCVRPEHTKNILHSIYQRCTRSAILPLARRYRADRRFDIRHLNTKFATDTVWSKTKSLHQNVVS